MELWVILLETVSRGGQVQGMISMVSLLLLAATRLIRSISHSWLSWVMDPLALLLLHLALHLPQEEPCLLVQAPLVVRTRLPEHCLHLLLEDQEVGDKVAMVGDQDQVVEVSTWGCSLPGQEEVRRMDPLVVKIGTILLLHHLELGADHPDHLGKEQEVIHQHHQEAREAVIMAVTIAGECHLGVLQVAHHLHLVDLLQFLLLTGVKDGVNKDREETVNN